jgi:Flp pilus assembly protein TadD
MPGSEPDAPKLVARAAQALDEARPRSAERLARRAVEAAPRVREAHRVLVLALAQGGRLPESLEAATAAVTTFPADGDIRHLHAVVLLESGDVVGARRAATRAVQLSPDLVPAHLLLARVHGLLGQGIEARSARRRGRQLLAIESGSR